MTSGQLIREASLTALTVTLSDGSVVLQPFQMGAVTVTNGAANQGPPGSAPAAGGVGGRETIGGNAPVQAPVLGIAVNVEPEAGTVLVRLPGESSFRRLVAVAQVQLGVVVDASRGEMELTRADGSAPGTPLTRES